MGRKSIDLTGQQFDKLKVIEKTDIRRGGELVWKVECSCGNTAFVRGSDLKRRNTRSCGCLQKEQASAMGVESGKKSAKDLTNKRFGRLNAIEPTDKRCGTSVVWKCECLNEGNIVFVSSHDLLKGNTQSCGCLQKETTAKRSTTHGLSHTIEYQRMKDRKRRDKEKLYDATWTMEMEVALKEFQTKCILCDSTEDLTIDHVFPLSKGNGLHPGNVVILCRHHNSVKATKDLYDLPIDVSVKLVVNAVLFEEYWNHKNNCIVNSHEK